MLLHLKSLALPSPLSSRTPSPPGRSRRAARQPPTVELPVVSNDSGNFSEAEAFLKASGVLEAVATQIRQSFRITTPIVVSAEVCGQANAFWNPAEQKVVLCYELADYFIQHAKIADDEEAKGEPDTE
jgi:Putative metallopeptidase